MRAIPRIVLVALILTATSYRLPAPISEVREKPKSQPTKTAAKKEVGLTASETSAIAAKLKELENKWEASIATHDPSVIGALVFDDFAGVSATGKVLNKAALIDQFKSDTDVYASAVVEGLEVHVNSSTMAIVTGTARERGKSKTGKAFERTFRFTDTWIRRSGEWRCTASQVTLVSRR